MMKKKYSITEGDLVMIMVLFIPSKLLTFYKEGYNFEMGRITKT